MKTYIEPETIPITPNPVAILLKLHSVPPFQTPELLLVSPYGTKTKQPDAQGNMTSFSIEQVAIPQEPTT